MINIYCQIHLYTLLTRKGERFLTYPKILVIESRRPPAGCESRLLKRREDRFKP